MVDIFMRDIILFKLTYISKDGTPYPNKQVRGDKLPSLIYSIGKITCGSRPSFGRNYVFHSLDNSEKNLVVAKHHGEIYRDTVWFISQDYSEKSINELKKKAIEVIKESKQKKLEEALNIEKCMRETIEFLEASYND